MQPLTILCSIAALAHLTAERDFLLFQKLQLRRIQKSFVSFFEWFGNLGVFFGRLVWATITPPYEGKEFLRQFDELGAKSLPLVALAGAATGVVITLSTRDSLVRFGANSFLPRWLYFRLSRRAGRSSPG